MLVACGGAPGDFAECPDAACRQFLVVEAWKGGPESVRHLLAQVEDEVELTVIMNRLRETYPDETSGLCDLLPEGLARQRCHRIHSRPHLEGETRAALPIVKLEHPGGGPSTRGRLRRTRSRFSWVTPVESECPQGGSRNACVQREAVTFSTQGESKRAGALCANLPTGTPRHECMVAAAQAWTKAPREVSETEGLDLCLAAGEMAYDCLGDMIAHLLDSAHSSEESNWAALTQQAADFRRTWEEWDSGFADLLVERFWSLAAMGALQSSGASSPPGVLPEEALLQLRCAVAHDQLNLGEQSLSLKEWGSAVAQAMEALPSPRAPSMDADLRVVDYWPSDREGESERAAVVYQDASRRTRGESVEADLAICVLEAAARVESSRESLLQEGLAHTDEAVRWTAHRLLQGLSEGVQEDQPWGPDHWSALPKDEATVDREDPRARGPDPIPGVGE